MFAARLRSCPANNVLRWVTFALDQQRFALPLDSVLRVVRAAEITPLPLAPDAVIGAIDVGGRILPVFDPRRRLRLVTRPLQLTDQFLIVRTARRTLALVVDAALAVVDVAASIPAESLPAGMRHLNGVLSLPDGLALIHDLDAFLTPEEESGLDSALDALGVQRER